MAVIFRLVCFVCLAANALAATAAPNIILITLDTVRADRMGFLGSERGLTPNLDALAGQSVVFTRAYAQVPLTTPSHTGILTGTYPQFNLMSDFEVPLAPELPYAPEILRSHGYGTAAFLASIILDPTSRLAVGFDRGFDTYDANFHMRRAGEDRYHSVGRRGDEVVARALAWLDHSSPDQAKSKQHPPRPFFMWVHLYDAHSPYDPPQPCKSKYANAPYDGGIAYVDSVVGRFLTQLRRRGLYDGALIAVMADHGEGLGDHGEETHGVFLYDATIHVPLVIKLPVAAPAGKRAVENPSAGKRIETRVELVDVLPTILQAVGIAVPQEVQGQSLLGIMTTTATAPSAERPAYAETDYPHRAFGWSSLRALRTGKYLYIQAPRPELYDQSSDPNAEHDLSASSTAVLSTLAGQLDTFRQKTSTGREAQAPVVDPETREKLAALEYAATDPNASKPGAKDLDADPKDKIEIANLSNRANSLRWEGNCSEAVPVLRQLIANDPQATPLYVRLGECLLSMKDFAQAATVFRKILELHPDLAAPRFQLGMALLASGDLAGAATELEIVANKEPRWDKPHLALATTYAQTERAREAVTECEKVLEFAPNHYDALLLEGQILLDSKQPEAALPRLEKAAELRPKVPDPHSLLADAYVQLGQQTDAARERAAAKRLGADGDE
jgi:arylsulfatase A-like enzyme